MINDPRLRIPARVIIIEKVLTVDYNIPLIIFYFILFNT